ncbi:NADH:ubiquinone oxidoreductase, partial [Tulasnella sp. 425]
EKWVQLRETGTLVLKLTRSVAFRQCGATSYAPTAKWRLKRADTSLVFSANSQLEKKPAELRGERSGLPEGPEEQRRGNQIYRQAASPVVVWQLSSSGGGPSTGTRRAFSFFEGGWATANTLEDMDEKHYNVVLAQSRPHNKQVTISDLSDIKEDVNNMAIPYDMLVYAVDTETRAFGIPGVKEKLPSRERLIESAASRDGSEEEVDLLMHIMVVGGGPTGVEFSGKLHDFIKDDLRSWYHELADKLKIPLLEPSQTRELIQYSESTFKEQNIEVLTKIMVREVKGKTVVVENYKGQIEQLSYGLLVWAAGNVSGPITRDLMAQLPQDQTNRRGMLLDDYLRLLRVNDV